MYSRRGKGAAAGAAGCVERLCSLTLRGRKEFLRLTGLSALRVIVDCRSRGAFAEERPILTAIAELLPKEGACIPCSLPASGHTVRHASGQRIADSRPTVPLAPVPSPQSPVSIPQPTKPYRISLTYFSFRAILYAQTKEIPELTEKCGIDHVNRYFLNQPTVWAGKPTQAVFASPVSLHCLLLMEGFT